MKLAFVAAAIVFTVAGCDADDTTPATSTLASSVAPSTTDAPLTGGPSGMSPGYELCEAHGARGGTYYIQVTSRTENDLSECNAGTPIQGGLDPLFSSIKGFDRRCHYDGVSDPSVHALVAVYSSSSNIDEAAAQDQCDAHNGDNS